MSRNIDLTKPLEELDEDDLRYAHDRNLLSPEDTERVGTWLRKKDAEASKTETSPDVTGPADGDTEVVLYDPLEHSVEDVNAYLAGLPDDGPGTEEYERVLAVERARTDRDPRKGIVGED